MSDYFQSDTEISQDAGKDTTVVEVPMASKEWDGGNPGPKFPIKQVQRLNKINGKMVVLTTFQDGQQLWIPEEFLDKKAQERFLDSDVEVTEMKYNLRSRKLPLA